MEKKMICSERISVVFNAIGLETKDICVDELKFNYIDFSTAGAEKISFIPENRMKFFTGDYFDESKRKKYGVMAKPGRFFKKIKPDLSDHQIRDIVSKYMARTTQDEYIIEESSDVAYWYNEKQYADDSGDLGNSCMRYDSCENYIKFYEKLNQNVVILKKKDDPDHILARAILWDTVTIFDIRSRETLAKDVKFMDRVYTHDMNHIDLMLNYARSKGYWHKKHQSYDEPTDVISPDNEEYEACIQFNVSYFLNVTAELENKDKDGSFDWNLKNMGSVPYMDTMMYFTYSKKDMSFYLQNDSSFGFGGYISVLRDTDGRNGIEYYINRNGDFIDENEAVYSEAILDIVHEDDCIYDELNGYIPNDIAVDCINEDMEKGKTWKDNPDYVFINGKYYSKKLTVNCKKQKKDIILSQCPFFEKVDTAFSSAIETILENQKRSLKSLLSAMKKNKKIKFKVKKDTASSVMRTLFITDEDISFISGERPLNVVSMIDDQIKMMQSIFETPPEFVKSNDYMNDGNVRIAFNQNGMNDLVYFLNDSAYNNTDAEEIQINV